MTYREFSEVSKYSTMTIAQHFLGYSESERIGSLAKALGFEPSDKDKTNMRYMVSGKKKFEELYGEAA